MDPGQTKCSHFQQLAFARGAGCVFQQLIFGSDDIFKQSLLSMDLLHEICYRLPKSRLNQWIGIDVVDSAFSLVMQEMLLCQQYFS